MTEPAPAPAVEVDTQTVFVPDGQGRLVPRDQLEAVQTAPTMRLTAKQAEFLEFRQNLQDAVMEVARSELQRLKQPGRVMMDAERLCLMVALGEILSGNPKASSRARVEYARLAQHVQQKREWQKQVAWDKKHGTNFTGANPQKVSRPEGRPVPRALM